MQGVHDVIGKGLKFSEQKGNVRKNTRLSSPAQLYIPEWVSLGARLPGNGASDKWLVYIALVLG